MELLHRNFKTGIVQIKITDLDDLWYLHQIIEPKDLVTGKTTRKIKIGKEENTTAVKKTLILTVETESLDFSESGTALRLNGKIKAGPEEVPKESYHVIEIEEGAEITIKKRYWLSHHKKKLEEAAEKKYLFLLCLFDREEALFALTAKTGYQILLKLKGDVPKKQNLIEVKNDFQEEIIKVLEKYQARYHPEKIILASPAFYKEDVFKKMKSPELKRKSILCSCYDVSESALPDVIKQPQLENALKDSRARKEQLLMDEVLAEIKKNNQVAYGWEEVLNAIKTGAVSKVLVTDTLIQKTRLEGKQTELDSALQQIDAGKGEVHILSSQHDAGKKLNGLGGIAALLRYKNWK